MKSNTKKSCVVAFIVVLTLLSTYGCTMHTNLKTKVSNVTNNEPLCSENINVDTDAITIYKITKTTFNSFLEKNAIDLLKNDSISTYTYSQVNPWYVTWNANQFIINQELLEFIGIRSNLESYLLDHNINDSIVSLAIFEAPNVPITIWAKTVNKDFFITINKSVHNKSYVYKLYENAEYILKYGAKTACLFINGNKTTTEYPVVLYSEHDAQIPLIAVLNELGATINWQNDTNAEIIIQQTKYYLDVSVPTLYKFGDIENNLIYQLDGSPAYFYSYNNELIVDNATLTSVLNYFCENATVTCDIDNLIIIIDAQMW